MKTSRIVKTARITAILILLFSSIASAEEGKAEEAETEHQNEISLFGGVTHAGSSNSGTIGLDYEWKPLIFASLLGIGGIVDNAASETLIAIPVFFHPYAGIELLAAAGASFSSDPTKFVFRGGAGYAFELPYSLVLTPNVDFDLSKDPLAIVYGLSVGISF